MLLKCFTSVFIKELQSDIQEPNPLFKQNKKEELNISKDMVLRSCKNKDESMITRP